MVILYKNLQEDEINRKLFEHFIRHQTVVKCWRNDNGKWMIKNDPFIDDWSEADYKFLISCLKTQHQQEDGYMLLSAMVY